MRSDAPASGEAPRVRLARGQEDLDACVAIQRAVWGVTDLEITGTIQLIATTHAGGVLFVAEDAAGDVAGFAYAFPALRDGEAHLHSDMLAVHPDARGRGLGRRLKWAQREEALRRGVHTLALILDNGPTHAPKQLEQWLTQESQARGWPLKIQVYWLPKNASWLDQIEIWFSILQRKLLKPNDFESLQALEKAIRSFIRYCNRSAKPIHWTYTVEKLEEKLGAH